MASNSILSQLSALLEREEGSFIPKEKLLSILRRKGQSDEDKNREMQEYMDDAEAEAINKSNRVLWSIKEVSITLPDDDADTADDGTGDGDKPKKKKQRKDALMSKKNRSDPNAPSLNPPRIPLPELRDSEKIDKVAANREAAKRLKLGPDSLPSICFYTLLNGHHHHNSAALCSELSEDSSLLAAGFSDSTIRVWALTPCKLKTMKPAPDLEHLDKDSEDVLYRMMDDKNTSDLKILKGHNGPVYALSFAPDRNSLLSCSEDATSMY